MSDNCNFIGIVTNVIDAHSFIFRTDNNVNCQIGQIIGLNINNNTFIFACIVNIDVDYFLTNSEEYFSSIASDNKLSELAKGIRSPKYSHSIKANYIGIYEYSDKQNRFIESSFSINSYTPKIFQEVVSFNFVDIETVYGLRQNSVNYFNIGKFLYPNYIINETLPDVTISPETFDSHTLISGVTGSGKSRLTALIANQLAENGGHITIIDPHNEYVNLANTKTATVYFYYRKEQYHEEKSDIYKRPLSLSYEYLKPQILTRLLPELSDQQKDYLFDVFENEKIKRNISFKNFIELMIEDFNFEFRIKGSKDKLQLANEYAEKDNKDEVMYYQRYLLYLSRELNNEKLGKLHVIDAVIKKVLSLFKEGIFPMATNLPIPIWLDAKNRNFINIINLDYEAHENVRRFVDTIIQCFLTPQKDSSENHRTLIVDEAHLLLTENSDTSKLLSRLLRESRKFDLSIIFITQNEKDVPEEIKSQFQNKFMFREENNQILNYLDDQTCMCRVYKGKLNFPMKVNHVESIYKHYVTEKKSNIFK